MLQTQLARHLVRIHKNEDEVKQAMRLPRRDRLQRFNNIKKKGILSYNIGLKNEGKELLCERRQGSERGLAMCLGCKGFYSKRRIGKHRKSCKQNLGVNQGTLCSSFVTEASVMNADEFEIEIVQKFKDDIPGNLCKKDPTIIKLGRKLWAKSARKERRIIMNDMRLFGRLLLEVQKVAHDDNLTGADLLDRVNFEHLSKAITNLTSNEHGHLKAGLKLAIGYILKKSIKVMKGHYIQENKMKESEEVDRFSALLELNWEFIFFNAQLKCEQRRQNLRKPADMPVEDDILVFRNFVTDEPKKMISDPYHKHDMHDFVLLRNLLVAKLTLFNARRGGEPARLLLTEWEEAQKGEWIDSQQIERINDSSEKELINDMKLAYQSGKGSRRLVPVLFPKDTIPAIEKLVEIRAECGIAENNPFLFPNTESSLDHVIGSTSIKSVVDKLVDKLKSPHLMTADKFRHRAATLFAQMDLPQEKRDIFYRHMGHSEQINKDVYQCPLAIREIREVGSFLKEIDTRTVHKEMHESSTSQAQSHEMTHAVTDVEKKTENNQNKDLLDEEASFDSITLDSHANEERATKDGSIGQLDLNLAEAQPPLKKVGSRRYMRWHSTDAEKVIFHFKTYIDDVNSSTLSRGKLPSKKEVEGFLSEHHIFEDQDLPVSTKVALVKAKVFNERKKKRENTFKLFK